MNNIKRQVKFVALESESGNRDGEEGWQIFVDGKLITTVDNDEMDAGDNHLSPLWEALNVELVFDYKIDE